MKRIAILLAGLAIYALNLFSEPVSMEIARQVGLSFLSKTVIANYSGSLKTKQAPVTLKLVYVADTLRFEGADSESSHDNLSLPAFYVFSADQQGFVIVSGDDRVFPVLGYADEGKFDPANISPTMQKWFEGYKNEIRYAIENNLTATPELKAEWRTLQSGESMKAPVAEAAVSPLLSTKWDQSPYYNAICPYDTHYGEKVVTGCVATAMAQVMKYWNYPEKGSGFHSYNHSQNGTLSANFGSTTYQWSAMPNQISSSNSAIATLMYHCGIAVEMNYNVASQGGSGAMTICSGYTGCTASAETALKTFFGYKSSLLGVHKSNYTNENWINLLKTELNARRPIVYAGRGSEGGHCFVCDGYDANNYFHFNWGWSGHNDGYYSLSALVPGSGGAGGGSYAFTDAQRAIIGVEPAQSAATPTGYDLRLYSTLNMSAEKVWFKSAFNMTVDIGNFGDLPFTGYVGAALFDSKYNFIDFMATYSQTINNGYFNTINFATTGSAALVSGTYYVAVFYKTTAQDWTIVSDGAYENVKVFEVYYSSDIETNSAFTITNNGGKLIQGSQATINVDVTNAGTSTFYGSYRVNLAKLDGSWAQNIQILNENNGLPSDYHYINGINFTGNITVAPGTYLMEIAYQKSGTSSWYYAGSSKFVNPVYVIVEAASLQVDPYENNNTQSLAYTLPLSFSGNTATRNTTGSTLHIGTDIDYYKVVLPPGYKYTLSPRLHDEYNSANGQSYSVDALFSYSVNGTTYSETYDDVMYSGITVNNGGTVYFKVAPYYSGNTGSYLFELTVLRQAATALDNVASDYSISIYPNPASDEVIIDIQQFASTVSSIKLCDLQGREVISASESRIDGKVSLPLNDVADGVYYIQIHADSGIFTQKVIVKR